MGFTVVPPGGAVGRALPELMSVADLAATASVSEKTVRRWLTNGQVTGVRVGARQIRVSVSSAMHLLRPEAERLGAKELAMQSNNEPEVRLGPQLKYTKEYTGEVDGVLVPLGTLDPREAKTVLIRTRRKYQELAESHSEVSTLLLRKNGRPTFLKYRRATGEPRETKRIPAELAGNLTSESSTEKYRVAASIVLGLVESPRKRKALDTIEKLTLGDLADAWFDGDLAARFSAHVSTKKSAKTDRTRFDKYIRPAVGSRLVIGLGGKAATEVADEVVDYMSAEAPDLSDASRRHVLQIYNRLLNLAVFPVRALERNDLPVGYLPKVRQNRAFSYLYPDEDAKLLGCQKVPVHLRLFFALQAREGARASEVLALTWKDVDLERGILKLDKNKTGRPRAWKMTDGTVEGLKRWKKQLSAKALAMGFILVDPKSGKKVPAGKGARQLRAALKEAKVKREELFEQSDTRMAVRAHDLRATFVTIALGTGKSEAWATDRTGHTTSTMLYKYKRAARTHAEAELGDLKPLHLAVPELRQKGDG